MCAVLNLKIFTFIGGNIAKVARFRVMVAVAAIFTTHWCKNARYLRLLVETSGIMLGQHSLIAGVFWSV
jgi:hypothetical protein